MKTKVEWKNAPDFAEIAEAIGVTTRQVMAAHMTGETITAVYTPEPEEDDLDPETMILVSALRPDGDGILRVIAGPVISPLNWVEMRAEIERRVGEVLGDA